MDELGAGDIGAVAKLKETRAGDVLAAKDAKVSFPPLDLPAPVMAFAFEPKTKGDEEKAVSAIRRLEEEDPTLDVHRDQQTGEQIIAGLTQVHVEVIVDRMKSRFGAEIELHPPRVPYLEAIRKPAKAHGRYKKQTGGRGQFGDCHIEIEPGEAGHRLRVRRRDQGRGDPQGLHPGGREGDRRGDAARGGRRLPGQGPAGAPLRRPAPPRGLLRERLQGGRLDGLQAGDGGCRPGPARADHAADRLVPEDVVGDVVGDLNSRRGRPLGMEAKGSVTEIKAEVPMAEVLDYAPDLRAITGGRGDYTMEFARHEEIPAHLAQKVISQASSEEEVRA